jgi:hypothetical protein
VLSKNMKATSILLVFCTGCTAVIHELKSPPYPYAAIHHTRAVGLEASIPSQTGDQIVKLRFGFFSDTVSLIPTCTNKDGTMTAAPISDTFLLNNSVSFTPTEKIIEDMTSGWQGQPPPPRYQTLLQKLHATMTETNIAPGTNLAPSR